MDANSLLIVEDSFVQAKIIRKQFEAFTNFNTIIAHSMAETQEAVDQYQDQIFAAVVDRNLPDAPDGEAVDIFLTNKIPCVVLTASFDEKLRQNFIEKRVADYFLKGSINDLDPLIACVERLHANYRVKALVVDDSATQRAIVQRLLSVQCITALQAADGVEALEVIESEPGIRLVITDFEMPRLNGIELVQEIRTRFRLSSMGIIGVSSLGSGTLTAKFLKHGANDFLTKPFEAEEFYWRVNQTLNILDVMEELKALRRPPAE